MKKQDCVYMLECADGSLYTGWTNDIESRLAAHNRGTGAEIYKRPGSGETGLYRIPARPFNRSAPRSGDKKIEQGQKHLLIASHPGK